MNSYDIVGYTYHADTYCPYCTAKMFTPDGESVSFNTESALDAAADELGIDRYDEYSYDSDEFPKVIFADQCEYDRCGECHEWIVEPPETYDDRFDLLLSLAHFTADYHAGQTSRLYRIGCRTHKRLRDEYGYTHPLDLPLNDTQRAIYDALVTNHADDPR